MTDEPRIPRLAHKSEALKARREYLRKRIEEAPNKRGATEFHKAEAAALDAALVLMREEMDGRKRDTEAFDRLRRLVLALDDWRAAQSRAVREALWDSIVLPALAAARRFTEDEGDET